MARHGNRKSQSTSVFTYHDDVIKWKHYPRYWPFVWGIHRSPVNSPHKGQWCGALMFSLICAWINGWVNNREAGDLRRQRTHCDATVMFSSLFFLRRLLYVIYGGEAHGVACVTFANGGEMSPILGLRPANERRRYSETTSLIGWAQA